MVKRLLRSLIRIPPLRKAPTIPMSKDVRNSWNASASAYSSTLERANLQLGQSLARMLNIHTATDILEAGCGSGQLTFELLMTLPSGINFTSIDLSDEMISIAEKNKEALVPKLSDINHRFIVGDIENLSSIPDESIDVYLSSLCLHLTPDPNKALQEALRVLKKGGRLGFSVLGSLERCSMFTLFSDREKELDIEPSKGRSSFYLGSREALIELAEENSVLVDFCWIETVTQEIFDEKDIDAITKLPGTAKVLARLDEETKVRYMNAVIKNFEDIKRSRMPLQTENVLLVGRKPG